jgi:ketosteroid isomerase-like protein
MIAALSGCAAARAGSSPSDTIERDIRDARDRFNAAIARRDTLTIAGTLLPTYHTVRGSSTQSHGAEAAMAVWRQTFARDTSVWYVRSPREIRVNGAWGLAEELGDWRGHLTAPDGPVDVSGVYSAKWQRTTSGRWRLQAEVFTTLDCRGGAKGCVPPDPVGP